MVQASLREVTGSEAGYSGTEQIRIALRQIVDKGGVAQTPDLYAAMEAILNPQGMTLSEQGRASLRYFVNKVGVEAGYVHPHDDQNPGWRIAPAGRKLMESEPAGQEAVMMTKIQIDASLRREFAELFQEFARTYPQTPDGQGHLALYTSGREQGCKNFYEIVAASDRGEDITDRVLLGLLPHSDQAGSREQGAWMPVAPAVGGNVKGKFEGAGWTQPDDWPRIAQAILHFVQRCNDSPNDLQAACDEFVALPHSKGFQCAMLTPILNALRPDDFLIINKKPRQTINYFAGQSFGHSLSEYPAINSSGRQLITELGETMHQSQVPDLPDPDLFDMFSHWLVAVKKFSFRPPRYWKIAPGEQAWNWDACRQGGFIAIGWDELGDISGLTKSQFDARRDELVAQLEGWTKVGTEQVWKFARIQEGDRIIANRGTTEVLGIGTVTGPYYFVPNQEHGHRLPVEWDDLPPRPVEKGGWRKTLIELNSDDFSAILHAPPTEPGEHPDSPFSSETFDMLAQLHEDPTYDFYVARKDELRDQIIEPFKQLFMAVRQVLPASILDRMETEKRIFANILKQFTMHGCWDFYWGAFYPKGGKRTEDAQLFLWINRSRLEYGFYIGEYGSDQRKRFVRNSQENYDLLVRTLEPTLPKRGILFFGEREDFVGGTRGLPDQKTWPSFRDWLKDPGEAGIHAAVFLPMAEVLSLSLQELARDIADTYQRLFPLVLLATLDDPLPAIGAYFGPGVEPDFNPEYPLTQCATDTSLPYSDLAGWIRAIERKGQAIIYGPPGTGKTYVAEHLARHLIGGGDGFSEVVQFHPAYAYEDFVQGIRPKAKADGQLDYPIVAGRFLEFCSRAGACKARCVLIIDEINRANLARVFGELMYLLEYRDREIPLAAGGVLRIPDNVRIIGTMNTADRSIALVDHALRRRFAFLALYPDYDILRSYHSATGFNPEPLIQVLRKLNRQIADRHYEVGITFFLRPDLPDQIQDIWRMEIEPYLEEYFFDQPEKADAFRWKEVGQAIFT